MSHFDDEEIRKLKKLLAQEGFDDFIEYVDLAAADYKRKAAWRLLIKTSRQTLVLFGGFLMLLATTWEAVTKNLGGFLRWLIGQ